MNKRRRLFIGLMLLLLGGYFLYNYLYQDHRNIEGETSKIEIAAPYLLERFVNNDGADLENKTITVTGLITMVEAGAITIDSSVYCAFDKDVQGLTTDQQISIKGRCLGYDELFGIVKLDQCTIIK
jgi:hypothetical protein